MVITYPIKDALYVNLTNRCPCACTFCLRQNSPGLHGSGTLWLECEPTPEEVLADLDRRELTAYSEIVFCGYGEPTERLDVLLAAARHIRAMAPDVPIRVNTNGLSDLIHGRPTAVDLKGLVDTVSISLNTPDADEYLRVCRPEFGAISYEAMKSFTRDCAALLPKVVMTVVDEPVTSRANQERCRAIAASLGATLRVRAYEAK